MTNVVDINTGNPVLNLLEDIKKEVLREGLSTCIIITVGAEEAEPLTLLTVSPDDELIVLGSLEKIKYDILIGSYLSDEE